MEISTIITWSWWHLLLNIKFSLCSCSMSMHFLSIFTICNLQIFWLTIPCALLNQPGSIQISDPNNALLVTSYYNYVKSKVKVLGLAKTYYSLALDEIGIESFQKFILLNRRNVSLVFQCLPNLWIWVFLLQEVYTTDRKTMISHFNDIIPLVESTHSTKLGDYEDTSVFQNNCR